MSSKIERVQTLFGTQDSESQTLNFIIGVGAVWVFLGIALAVEWSQVISNQPLPLLVGTALAYALLPVFIVVGGHELAHEFIADEYCEYETHSFAAFKSTTLLTIGSILLAVTVLLLNAFEIVQIPTWVVFLGAVSPGAVIAKGRSQVPQCVDEVAIVGPLYNLVIGLVFLYGGLVLPSTGLLTGEFAPILPAATESSLTAGQVVMSLTAFLSLSLGAFNALPIGPLDGRKVWASGDSAMKALLLVIIAVPIFILGSNFI